MGKRDGEQGSHALRLVGHILFGGVVALVASLIFLVFASLGVASGWLKEGLMAHFTVASCVVGSLIGGLSAVSRHRGKGVLIGAGVGACLFLFLVTLGYLYFDGMSVEHGGGAILAGSLCGGALSGLLVGSRPKKGGKGTQKRKKDLTRRF